MARMRLFLGTLLLAVGAARGAEEIILDTGEPIIVEEFAEPLVKWTRGVQLGINGSDGNSRRFNFRGGFTGKRTGPRSVFDISFLYLNAEQNRVQTESKALLNTKQEWLLGDSPYSIYTYGNVEYDEFQAWDYRIAAGSGISRTWMKTERTTFKTRVGAGFSREINGPDDSWIPELNLGFDFEHQLTERQKITITSDYFPDLTNFSDYRTVTRAAYSLLVDPKHNLSLQAGLMHRYDSTPNGLKESDIDYFMMLAWNF